MSIAYIIVTWNGERYIEGCLSGLLKQLGHADKVVCVDNGSKDGTLEILKKFERIVLVENENNTGFASAVNQGLGCVAEADWIVLLNQDVDVSGADFCNWLAGRKPGIYGPAIRREKGTKIYKSWFSFPGFWTLLFSFSGFKRGHSMNSETNPRRVDYLEGSVLSIHREVLEKVGLFDEGYFFYHEEMDFCYRAGRSGFAVNYDPDTEVVHYGGASADLSLPESYYLGLGRFIGKHYGCGKVVTCMLGIVTGTLLSLLFEPGKWRKKVERVKLVREGYRKGRRSR